MGGAAEMELSTETEVVAHASRLAQQPSTEAQHGAADTLTSETASAPASVSNFVNEVVSVAPASAPVSAPASAPSSAPSATAEGGLRPMVAAGVDAVVEMIEMVNDATVNSTVHNAS